MIDPIARAQRWQVFWEEEGGLRDIMNGLHDAYLDRMSSVEPWETDKLVKLSIASKITKAVASEVQNIVAQGKVAEKHRDHIKKIEKLPASKRRWI